MLDILFSRQGLVLFGLPLRWYGLAVVGAALVGILVAAWLARRDSRDPEHAWCAMVWIAPWALIGARLWFVLFPPQSVVALGRTPEWMLRNFFDLNQGAIAVWSGGLGLFGGILGGLVGLVLYLRHHRQPMLPWLDIAAVALALGQAIGYWGSGANQDLYGPPTGLPWGMLIDDAAQRVGPYQDLAAFPLDAVSFHPVWLYESLLSVLAFSALLVLFLRRRGRLRPGDIALGYVLLYGSGRFVLEFLRVNVSLVGGVNVSQAAAGLAVAAALGFWYGRQRRNRQARNQHVTIP